MASVTTNIGNSDNGGEIMSSAGINDILRSIDINDTAVLWRAIRDNSLSVVRDWVKSGGNIEQKNEDGNTPLTFALRNKRASIANYLLEAGANPSIAGSGDYAPIMCAISYVDDIGVFEQLLNDDRVDLNHQDKDGDTPLMEAVRSGESAIIFIFALLDKGADPYMQNYAGQTLWDIAKENLNSEFIGELKKRIYPLYNGFTREGMDSVSISEKQADGISLKQRFNFRAQLVVTTMHQEDATTVVVEAKNFRDVPRRFLTDAQQALKHMK